MRLIACSCVHLVSWQADGYLDLYLANTGSTHNALLRNNAGSGFTQVTTGVVYTDRAVSNAAAWGDVNADGFLDLVVANNRNSAGDTCNDALTPTGITNSFYINDGAGGFTKVTSGAVATDHAFSNDLAFGDVNSDGHLDLVVANSCNCNVGRTGCSTPSFSINFLYINDGAGNFTRAASGDITTDEAMSNGVAFGDYNNDGHLDLVFANMGSVNHLYTGNGTGGFLRVTAGVVATDSANSRAVAWGDYDGDGWLDLVVANMNAANFLYRNDGSGGFSRVMTGAIATDSADSYAVAWADVNLDGHLDLYVANWGTPGRLYINSGSSTGVRLPGPHSQVRYRCPSFMTQLGDRCVECPRNIITDNTGQCAFSCPAGFVRGGGQAECSSCPAGTAFDASAGVCEPCPAGRHSSMPGSLQCSLCALGSYSPSDGATDCLPCPVGQFSALPGQSACSQCPRGGFCATVGAASASMTFEPWCAATTRAPHSCPCFDELTCRPCASNLPVVRPARTIQTLELPTTAHASHVKRAQPTRYRAAFSPVCALTVYRGV